MTKPSTVCSGLLNEEAFTETVVLDDDGDAVELESPRKRPATGDGIGVEAGEVSEQPKWVGKRLGRFKLLRLLGQGGMGVVIQAQDIHLGRIVALKVLRKQIEGVDDQQRVDQFLREAKSAALIEHPNAAQVYEINEHKGWWYIASELIEGGTLHQIVKAAGRLDPAQACPLIADAASVLAAAHQAGIIHRDIKPHNLMLTRLGRCKVVDFGLVRIEDPNDPFDFTERAVGTPDYLPPEAAKRGRPTPAYDIYSLAGTLYFALTGRAPFKAASLAEMVKQHREAPRPDVREINPHCSERLAELIKLGMSIEPEKRPGAADFAAALRVESIGTDFDPAALVQGAAGAAPTIDPHGSVSGISALPLSESAAADSAATGFSAIGSRIDQMVRPGQRVWLLRVAVGLIAVGLAFLIGISILKTIEQGRQTADREAFLERFPNAPQSYGSREAGTAPPSIDTLAVPAFSWRAQIDPGDNRYVSSTDGTRAYPIDHPAAVLIRADRVRFFATADDARVAGKTVAE